MFTINEFTFTDSNTRYFSNINHLAKDIKKLFDFLSNRELTIFSNLDKIKHTQLLQVISKALGFYSYDEKNVVSTINIEQLNKIFQFVSTYIYDATPIKEELVNEVFTMLLLNLKYSNKASLKSIIAKKIKNRMDKMEIFYKLDIFSEKKRTKIQKKENDEYRKHTLIEDYTKFNELWENFKYFYSMYKTISEKKYRYVWYPYAFEKQEHSFSFNDIEKYSESLKKMGMYQYFLDLKKFIPETIVARNLNLFEKGNIEESYYVQNHDLNKYVEMIIQEYEDDLKHHCGSYLIVGPSPLESLKQAHLENKLGTNAMLKKITWYDNDPEIINIHTYNDLISCFLCKEFISFHIYKDNSEEYTSSKTFYLQYLLDDINSLSHFGTNTYDTYRMKNFFLYKTEKDFLEYIFIMENETIYKVEFRINELIIKAPEQRFCLTYNELFLDINHKMTI